MQTTGKQLLTLVEIINKVRMLKTWDLLPAGKADAYARTWAEVLNFAGVPVEHYQTLYKMSFENLLYARKRGAEVPEITADYLAAQWEVLKEKLLEEEIRKGRTLPSTAESVCQRCMGIGMENIYSPTGRHLGCRPRCEHKPIEPGEGIWIHINTENVVEQES